MSSSIPSIVFKSVDPNSVESVEDNAEAVTFEVVLNAAPPAHWIEEFDYLYTRAQFGLKPPIHIDGDRMRILYLPRYSEELQNFITFLSLILDRATEEARRTVEIQQTDERQKIKADFKTVLSKLDISRSAAS